MRPAPLFATLEADSSKRCVLALLASQAVICDCQPVKSLEPPDNFHLSAAMGWLGLGNWQEAHEELEKIALAFRAHPDVLEIRLEIYSKAGKWDLAAEIAGVLVQIRPSDAQFWITHAYATRRMPGGGIPQAKQILSKAQRLFPKEALIPYNLACYACQLGDHKEARKWLEIAFDLGGAEQVKRMALKDPDLEPLRTEIEK
jgi:tetratricopeptide (TPR) repeat protein